MPRETILIVEDEQSLVDVLTYNLTREGYEVEVALDGRDGLQRARTLLPDLVVLDLMLPLIDGMEVCRRLRADTTTQHIRILILTARADEIDEIVGFHMGADDYVVKPFKLKPLIQRIKALLRRPSLGLMEADVVERDGLDIDRLNHRAALDGNQLDLTPTEFRLLWTLLRQPGRTFSRMDLLDASRGSDANSMERTIDVHVRSLRQKLGDRAELIQTVRGVGYRCPQ
jgi:two-component system phosphate regulon response regulator PhoB|tara:strand:+ start:756 stop:1439 length:684 start_codon:yes stop_codon:yes gene_type:complete